MALVTETHSVDFGSFGLISSLREAVARRKIYRQTVRELRNLSGRELRDLGLNRSMITRVALEAVYGK